MDKTSKTIKTTAAYRRNVSGYSPTECCARCGKYMPDATTFVAVGSNGMYPVGADCAEVLAKLGHEIE